MPSSKFNPQDTSEKRDPEEQGFKQVSFQALHCLHRANQSMHNGFYYLLMLIEFLQIFYYFTHPFFPYYQNSAIMTSIHQFLKYLVFNEFLTIDSNLYRYALPVCFAFIVMQIVLMLIIAKEIKQKKLINEVRKIHFVANVMFLVLNSIFTIPFFGISINVLYCDAQSNKYTLGQACYQGSHIGYCLIATFVIVTLLIQWGINWYIYYNKNPFGNDFLSKYDNNAVLGKFLLKILPIVYMSIDNNMSLVNVFIFGLAGCMCGYIFFFRLFSFHDYNERNFYFVLFLEVVLAWFSINNIILSYLDTDRKAGGLFESFLCSLLVAALVVQIEEENYKKIFMEGLQAEKIKKQNIEKFLYRLIYMFTHSKTDDQKNQLSTIVKILSSKLKDTLSDPSINQLKISKKVEKKFYNFLSRFVLQYLESNWNIMLMCINCNLLILDEKFSYAFHQSLELSSKKISVVQELMMYRFRRHQRYDKEKVDTSKKENNNIFMMYYDFNQNLMKLEEEIATCTFNNLDYWEQVCQPNPSIYKIRNLAEKYEEHMELIDIYYNKIYDIFPNNKLAIKTYIEFLVYVGVNISGLSKAKERYQQAEENIKKTKELQRDSGNLIEMGENQNLAFVSIQTCEMSLATITNCNTQFKKMLGYDKHELIDKKVNKLMPKAFNQFHDGLVRGYIQKKQHNEKNKVQRVVYALSKENYLVEVVLFTKVNFKTIGEKSSLELIGFLKKIQDPNKAVIILEVNSMNIVGANAGFSKLIEDGINNSQFANSQIKIMTLLPNINASLIEQGKSQQTNLVFSSSVIVTKSGLNLQVKKKVTIEVEQIKEYSSKQKLAYLALKEFGVEDQDEPQKSKKSMKNVRIENQVSNHKKSKDENRKVKVLTSQVSIMDDQFSIGTFDSDTMKAGGEMNDKDQEMFHMIERKKDEFLKNQHLDVFRYILWGTLITFICLTIGLLVFATVLDYDMITSSNEIKGQIKNSYVIGYETAQINKMIQKVMQASGYNESEFNENSKKLSASITRFQENFIPMMTMSTKYEFPLELNQFRYYDIVIENQDSPEYAEETIIDAFFQYISSAKNYAAYTIKDVTTAAIHEMVQENDFIQENGKELFPTISKKMSLQYLDLDKFMFQHFTIKQFIITVSYAANVVTALFLIAVLIKKINTFNQNVVSLYNEIKLWDATEMKNKCIKFVERNSNSIMKTHNNKRRMSSLLNVFPQETFIKVLESVQGYQMNKKQEKINRSNNANRKSLNNSNQDEQLLKIENSQQEQGKEAISTKSAQKSRKFYVLLPEKNKLRKKFIVFGLIAAIFIGGYFMEYFYSSQYEKKILYYNERISQLGKVRNNIAFINYYTYELMLKPNDQTYRRLFKSEISEFYTNTDTCYDLIGDPSPILKKSYNVVEQAYALIFSNLNIPLAQRYNIKNPKYLLQEFLFQQSIQDISNIIQFDLDKMANDLISNVKSIKLAFIISYIFLNLLLAFIIKFWMLQEILKNSKKSKSMISMLPPWLIERNKGISQIMQ